MTKPIYEAILFSADLNEHRVMPSAEGVSLPSNQQILDAARNSYSKYQPAVDAATTALANIISSQSLMNEVLALDQVNWHGPVNENIGDPFYTSNDVITALSVSNNFPELNSFSVAVFSKELPNGGVGMIGFNRGLRESTATSGLSVKLDIFKHIVKIEEGKNLQFGIWIPKTGTLDESVYGFYTDVVVSGVNINLKIMITSELNPYGFVVSSGAKVKAPVGAAVFSGSTSSPQF